MRRLSSLLAGPATALGLFLLGGTGMAQAILDPPFGLHWGDSAEKLITWADDSGLDVTIRVPGNKSGLRIIRIEQANGFLPGTKANAIEGRFLKGKLFELAVHYSDPSATANEIRARFEELRREIAAEYGKLRSNKHQRAVEDQFVTRTESFHREPVKGLFLLLAYTEVEDLLRESRQARFSLIYRNNNFRQQLEAAPDSP